MACNRLQAYSEDVLNSKSDKGSKNRGKEEIVKPDPSARNLPDWVFVVQFSAPSEPGSSPFAGRAEHAMSGEREKFETPAELVAFLERVLKRLEPRSEADPR